MARETAGKLTYLMVALVPLTIGAQAVHWFTKPTSAAASDARWWAVAVQALLGLGVGCWLLLKGRSQRRHG